MINDKTKALIKKEHVILNIAVFIVMTGYGLTLTVMPFYVERMALSVGANLQQVSAHVGLLTGIFALMQFFFRRFGALCPTGSGDVLSFSSV